MYILNDIFDRHAECSFNINVLCVYYSVTFNVKVKHVNIFCYVLSQCFTC